MNSSAAATERLVGITTLVLALFAYRDLVAQRLLIPVERDPTIEEVSYSEFDGQSPEEIWQTIETLDSWAIPQVPPAGYYDIVDETTPEALRHTVHEHSRPSRFSLHAYLFG
jgi:hypothetical protein